MAVPGGSSQAGVAQGVLDQVHGSATVKGMAGVAMPEPMRRDVAFDAGPAGCGPYQAQHCGLTQVATLPRPEHRILTTGVSAEL